MIQEIASTTSMVSEKQVSGTRSISDTKLIVSKDELHDKMALPPGTLVSNTVTGNL